MMDDEVYRPFGEQFSETRFDQSIRARYRWVRLGVLMNLLAMGFFFPVSLILIVFGLLGVQNNVNADIGLLIQIAIGILVTGAAFCLIGAIFFLGVPSRTERRYARYYVGLYLASSAVKAVDFFFPLPVTATLVGALASGYAGYMYLMFFHSVALHLSDQSLLAQVIRMNHFFRLVIYCLFGSIFVQFLQPALFQWLSWILGGLILVLWAQNVVMLLACVRATGSDRRLPSPQVEGISEVE